MLFSIQNDQAEPLTVSLEPLAREIVLKPGETAHAFDVLDDDDCPAEIVAGHGKITVWLNFEGYLFHDGQVTPNHPYDSDDVENIRKLKEHQSEMGATRAGWRRRNLEPTLAFAPRRGAAGS